jgi:hypothetical protein
LEENIIKKLPHIGLIALILSAAVVLTVDPAYAIKYSISGQINRAVLYANDGLSRRDRIRVDTPRWEGFYGTYYLHMLDRNQGSNIDDIDVVMAGARVKF